MLNERYLVEHKLGFGGFSTVWMVHDLHEKRDVALKVMCLGDHGDRKLAFRMKLFSVQDISHVVNWSIWPEAEVL